MSTCGECKFCTRISPETGSCRFDPFTNPIVEDSFACSNYLDINYAEFFVKTWFEVDGPKGTVENFAFSVPEGPQIVHAEFRATANAEFRLEIYEGAVISGGTPAQSESVYRNMQCDSGLQAISNPAVSDYGHRMWDAIIAERQEQKVVSGINYHIDAKWGTTYVFKITKLEGKKKWVDFDFFWREYRNPFA